MGSRSTSPLPGRIRPLILSVLFVLLAACAGPEGPTDGPQRSDGISPGPSASAAAAFPVTLTDDAGREVTLESEPLRIVSLAPSNTEIVCALGACDRLVGVTDFDDYPPEVADVDHVVISAQVDVERVRAAEPDLVLAAGNEFTATTVIEQLTDLGMPVVTLYAASLEEVYVDIRLVGEAIGASAEADAIVAEMEADAAAVVEAVSGAAPPRTFYEVSYFEGTIYTAGEDSFLASLIELAGGDPITGDPQSFAIELEDLVAADPELILLGDASYDPSITAESVAARAGWGEMAAVRDGRIVPVADDVIITRPGPRIVEGLEALARAIHPDRFE